jgi:hypothetical protein
VCCRTGNFSRLIPQGQQTGVDPERSAGITSLIATKNDSQDIDQLGGTEVEMPDKKLRSIEPDMGSLELTEDLIRKRAYEFYEERGHEHGHDVDDWLRAVDEVMGKTALDLATPPVEITRSAAA